MAITVTHRVATPSTSNAQSYNTTVTPAAGDLLIVAAIVTGRTVQPAISDNQSLGWTLVASALKNSSADALWVWVSQKGAVASSTIITVGSLGSNATGCMIMVTSVAGMARYGVDAYVQAVAASNGAASTAPAVSSLASINTKNTLYGVVANGTSPATLTQPASWTELSDPTGYSSPTTGMESCYRLSGGSGTSITWGSNSSSAWAAVVIELASGTIEASNFVEQQTQSDAVTPAAAPYLVQHVEGDFASVTTSGQAVAFSNNVEEGNLIYVGINYDSTGGISIAAVADTQGNNKYVRIAGPTVSPDRPATTIEVWACQYTAAGACTVAFYPSGTTGRCLVSVMELRGVTGKYLIAVDGFYSGSGSSLRLCSSDGASFLDLTDGTYNDYFPDWSPDGKQIVFCRQFNPADENTKQIMLMDIDGTNIKQLTTGNNLSQQPHISPDGTKIVFRRRTTQSPAHDDIYTMNIDGTGLTNVTSGLTTAYTYSDPRWTPDGKIVFILANIVSAYNINSVVCAINADGTGFGGITSTTLADADPNISPDGTMLVFQRMPNNFAQQVETADYTTNWDIIVKDLSLGTETTVASGPGYAMVSWAKDGSYLIFSGYDSASSLTVKKLKKLFPGESPVDFTNNSFLHNYNSSSYYGSSPVDKVASGTNAAGVTSQPLVTDNVDTIQARELLVGCAATTGVTETLTPGSGYTLVANLNTNGRFASQIQGVGSKGSYNSSFADSANAYWASLLVTFKVTPDSVAQQVRSAVLTDQLMVIPQLDSISTQVDSASGGSTPLTLSTLTDQQTQSDGTTSSLVLLKAISDSQPQSDASVQNLSLSKLVGSDQQVQADAFTKLDIGAKVSDSTSQADASVRNLLLNVIVGSDQQVQADAVNPQKQDVAATPISLSTLTDQQTQSDTVAQNSGLNLVGADQQVQADALTKVDIVGKVSDSQTQADAPAQLTLGLNTAVGSDQQVQADQVAQQLALNTAVSSDQQTQSDAVSKLDIGAKVVDSQSQSDAVAQFVTYGLQLADQQAQADAPLQTSSGGGLTLSTLSDQQPQSDSLSTSAALFLYVNDSLAQSDSLAQQLDQLQVLSDSLVQVDSATENVGHRLALADSQAQADAVDPQKADVAATPLSLSTLADQQQQYDTSPVTVIGDWLLTASDALTFLYDGIATEVVVGFAAKSLDLADQQTQSDSAALYETYALTLADSQPQSDAISNQVLYNLVLSDSQTQSDTSARQLDLLVTVSDSLSQSDTIKEVIDDQVVLGDVLAQLDTANLFETYALALADTQSQSDAPLQTSYGGGLTLSTLADAQPQSDVLTLFETYGLSLEDSNSQTDLIAESLFYNLQLEDLQTETDSYDVQVAYLLQLADQDVYWTDNADVSGGQPFLSKTLQDSLTQSDQLDLFRSYLLQVSDQQTQADSIATEGQQPFLQLSLNDSLSQSDGTSLLMTCAVPLADAQTQTDTFSTFSAYSLGVSDTQSQLDEIAQALNYLLAINDSNTQADSSTRQLDYLLGIADTVSQSDAFKALFTYSITVQDDGGSFWTDNLNWFSNQPFLFLSLTDSLAQSDDYKTFMTHALTVTDSNAQLDDYATGIGVPKLTLADTAFNAADAVGEQLDHLLKVNDSQTQAEALRIDHGLLCADGITQADGSKILMPQLISFSDTLSQVEDAAMFIGLKPTEQLTQADEILAAAFFRLDYSIAESVGLYWADKIFTSAALARGPMAFYGVELARANEFTSVTMSRANEFYDASSTRAMMFNDIDLERAKELLDAEAVQAQAFEDIDVIRKEE